MSSEVSNASQQPIAPNKPIVGSNVYTHATGMHQDAMIKSPLTYQPFDPTQFGFKGAYLPISNQSGRAAIRCYLTSLSLKVTDDIVDKIFHKIRSFETPDGLISDQHMHSIIKSVSRC